MTRYIVKMIWVCLFASLIAANVGATIITETRITTTKIAVSAHSHTRPLDLASSDSKILKVDAISVDVHTPETGADKRQISINTTTIIPVGDSPVETRVHNYCLCAGQSTTIPLLTGCDGSRVCPNQVDLLTDREADVPVVVDVSCTEQLPSMSFWDSCVYASRTPGWLEYTRVSTDSCCWCNLADDKSVTRTWDPVAVNCGRSLCHNSAPLERRAVVSPERMEALVLSSPSVVTAVTPLVSVTTDATPGSLPTANTGPTSVPAFG